MANRLQTALEELLHTVHHTMAVDLTPGAKILGQLASPRPASIAFWLIGPNQVRGFCNQRCKKEYWAYDQKLVNWKASQPKGGRLAPNFSLSSPSFAWKLSKVPAYKPRIGSSTTLEAL